MWESMHGYDGTVHVLRRQGYRLAPAASAPVQQRGGTGDGPAADQVVQHRVLPREVLQPCVEILVHLSWATASHMMIKSLANAVGRGVEIGLTSVTLAGHEYQLTGPRPRRMMCVWGHRCCHSVTILMTIWKTSGL